MRTLALRTAFATAFVGLAYAGTSTQPVEAASPPPCDIASYCGQNYPGMPMCDQCLNGNWSAFGFNAFTAANGGASCVPCSNAMQVPAAQLASCNACDAAGGTYAIDTDECFVGGVSNAPACQPAPACDAATFCQDNYPGAEGPCTDCLEGDHLLPWGFGAFSVAAGGASCMPCSNPNIPAAQTAQCDACMAAGGTYSVDTDDCFFGGTLDDPACPIEVCEVPNYCDTNLADHFDFCHECLSGGFGWSALVVVDGPSCVPCESHWLDPAQQHACDMCSSQGGQYSAITNECFIDGMVLGSC